MYTEGSGLDAPKIEKQKQMKGYGNANTKPLPSRSLIIQHNDWLNVWLIFTQSLFIKLWAERRLDAQKAMYTKCCGKRFSLVSSHHALRCIG